MVFCFYVVEVLVRPDHLNLEGRVLNEGQRFPLWLLGCMVLVRGVSPGARVSSESVDSV